MQNPKTYRQRLLQKYPIMSCQNTFNPAYYRKKMAELKMAEKTYEDAYTHTQVKNSKMQFLISDMH